MNLQNCGALKNKFKAPHPVSEENAEHMLNYDSITLTLEVSMSKAQRQWAALMRSLAVEPRQIRKQWLMLSELYSDQGRHYHTMKHVTHFVDALFRFGDPDAAMLIAAFFHDAVYDSRSTENELRSAALAVTFLKENGLEALTAEVDALIMASAKHRFVPGTDPRKQALFLDCDLLIIGESKKRYETYVRQIRQEYMHYDDAAYRSGRSSVMTRFLAREPIYLTPAVYELHEAKAKANIRRELKALSLVNQ